jgi:hypothetical protein
MSNNRLKTINLNIKSENFTNLKVLRLNNNDITGFPEVYVESLIELNLAGNRIQSVPYSISRLKNLETLIISDYKGFSRNYEEEVYLSTSIVELENLKTFICSVKRGASSKVVSFLNKFGISY